MIRGLAISLLAIAAASGVVIWLGMRHVLVGYCGIYAVALGAVVLLLLMAGRKGAPVVRGPSCAACGYDLTGNTSGVCPECGTAI
jgi:hypothetical protein